MRQLKINQRFTDRSTISINKYFDEVNKIPRLSAEDELKYAKLARGGDELAKEILVKSNLRFVISVAKQYQNQGIDFVDLINEGNMGLIEAVGRFDPDMGYKLISYAVWYIRRSILDLITTVERKCNVPKSRVSRMYKLKTIIGTFQNKLERDIVPADLYGIEDFSDREIDELVHLINGTDTSMDKTIGEDGATLGDFMTSSSYADINQDIENDYNSRIVTSMVKKLRHQDAEIVNYLHGLNGYELLSMTELADRLGLSRQRVDQIYKRALRVMRVQYKNVMQENI
jgi:RNA polymerase primary sigma factor